MKNQDRKYVLVACECSQTVCAAFREVGAIAYSCDIEPSYGGHPEWHIQGDCLTLRHQPARFLTEDGQIHSVPHWDLVIAHPPCTYLSRAGAFFLYPHRRFQRPRYKKGLQARKFFYDCLNFPARHVCVENPKPYKVFRLPVPNDCVQPYEHGHKFSKRTLLWLRNLPPLLPTCFSIEHREYVHSTRGSKCRSKFFEGIARAMATQWFPLL